MVKAITVAVNVQLTTEHLDELLIDAYQIIRDIMDPEKSQMDFCYFCSREVWEAPHTYDCKGQLFMKRFHDSIAVTVVLPTEKELEKDGG